MNMNKASPDVDAQPERPARSDLEQPRLHSDSAQVRLGQGIETYRQWVQQNQKRQYPVPKHIREALGMRSVFMCNWQPRDGERDILWKFADLPTVAEECKNMA